MKKILLLLTILYSSLFSVSVLADGHISADAIENANPIGQEINFWVQYSDERLDAMKARAARFEKGYGIKVNVVHKGHYGKVQSAMMSAAALPYPLATSA